MAPIYNKQTCELAQYLEMYQREYLHGINPSAALVKILENCFTEGMDIDEAHMQTIHES